MAKQGSIFLRFRNFDAYAKTLDDFRVKTTTGALVTTISALIIGFLMLSEFFAYRTPTWQTELVVDKSRKEKLPIHFNITFPKMPCHMLTLDVMDDAGAHISGYTHNVFKVRLDLAGQQIQIEKAHKLGDLSSGADLALQEEPSCGSCYGAKSIREDGCCNTCAEVREAYVRMGWGFGDPEQIDQCLREGWREKIENQSNEGCNIHGELLVNKVRGNFHIAPGQSFRHSHMHIHDLNQYMKGTLNGHTFDMSHTIHSLKFGPDGPDADTAAALTVQNPLAGVVKQTTEARIVYQYFLKIVSTKLQPIEGSPIYTNQYSFTQNERTLAPEVAGLPGVFFNMDISPMLIIYQEVQSTFTSFLTGALAIIGGIFTVAGLIDRVMYRAERTFRKKVGLGKTL
ncbi:endoplasmic reticulum vesicle transporter-domain-containing protein [Radiomyces spectabilis]|uniref:endoplasmic reticulum vesicle transporter-domain-containing protein n=1 Tax=Radiomyces spectabilis TaxID=64574 RepID=UPI00221F741D|nr:endoplasmic reticulum vesicle transporter-domain-containing protein [Radiomyces spectabilis]KAI8364804.1 endoplasmic reticulum vesicle transporter-domain-containing protein [Radiomyces spectabilis]